MGENNQEGKDWGGKVTITDHNYKIFFGGLS